METIIEISVISILIIGVVLAVGKYDSQEKKISN